MTIYSSIIVYPEGDTREISHGLKVNQLVDINGNIVSTPISTDKMILYRVYKISTKELKGEVITSFFLEILNNTEKSLYL